jgi:hypothetical protein
MPAEPSPGDIDSCAAFSSPSSRGEGLLFEAVALERPEASLVMAIALQEEVPRCRCGWKGSASRKDEGEKRCCTRLSNGCKHGFDPSE